VANDLLLLKPDDNAYLCNTGLEKTIDLMVKNRAAVV
jgi:hypothetical protein